MNQCRILSPFFLICLLLAACQNEPSPYPTSTNQQVLIDDQPATGLPTRLATATLMPPSATPEPTATVTSTSTAVPTPTIIPNTVQSPETIQAGEMLALSGSWNREAASLLQIIVQISEWVLVEGETAVSENGHWEATFSLPPQISGAATITVGAADNTIMNPLLIEANLDSDQSYVTLENPSVGQTAVSGYGTFFDGMVNKPIGGTIVIGILVDGCTRFATGQTFELGNGLWSGLLVIPSDISGKACAIVRTGDPDAEEGDWAAHIVPLPILVAEDVDARRVSLGNTGELIFEAGEVAEVFGTAVHAPNNRVNIIIASDDGSHILLAEATVAVNGYGFWEADILLPDSYTGFALLTISTGNEDDYQEERIPILITK